jgi:ATP/maltotriose-dependent transcriptional regulator MalT
LPARFLAIRTSLHFSILAHPFRHSENLSKAWEVPTAQGEDFERGADVVEQHTLQLCAPGKLDQFMNWIQKLPADFAAQRPWLSIHHAWVMAFAGKNSEVESLI